MDIYERIKGERGLCIGIIDADLLDHGTRHPNLALLKISAFCKAHGHNVELVRSYEQLQVYDELFLSCVFSFTHIKDGVLELPNIHYGGTGLFADGGENLPNEVEHSKPDYTLYLEFVNDELARGCKRSHYADYLDYSIGFTTRGCFRKCSFCVNKKYDHVLRHAPVSEFLDESRPYIYLWDDNFLAYPHWAEVLEELEQTGKPFQFRQGLDVRLMTNAKAKALSRCRYHGDFIFAFDHLEDRELIERKLALWRTWTDKGTRLYVLSAYDSQDERDIESVFERIHILMRYDCLPYIMRYESYKDSRWRSLYVNIARWCNQPQFFKKKSFREFCEANQKYHKNKKTLCSAYKAMTEFEREFPELAARYFDLKFEEESMMRHFGRRFVTEPHAEELEMQLRNWRRFASGSLETQEVLKLYYSKKLDIVCAEKLVGEGSLAEQAVSDLFDVIRRASLDDIYAAVRSIEELELITPQNVPQFSQVDDAVEVHRITEAVGEPQTFEQLGIYLCNSEGRKPAANKKYGENHAKLSTLLDLTDIFSGGGASKHAPRSLGVCMTGWSKMRPAICSLACFSGFLSFRRCRGTHLKGT